MGISHMRKGKVMSTVLILFFAIDVALWWKHAIKDDAYHPWWTFLPGGGYVLWRKHRQRQKKYEEHGHGKTRIQGDG